MSYSVLNDLAEAMKALDGKKTHSPSFAVTPLPLPSSANKNAVPRPRACQGQLAICATATVASYLLQTKSLACLDDLYAIHLSEMNLKTTEINHQSHST